MSERIVACMIPGLTFGEEGGVHNILMVTEESDSIRVT
jgi:hypothetical protein